MKIKIVFLQPKRFKIDFRLWSLTADFLTLCLPAYLRAPIGAGSDATVKVLNLFACSTYMQKC